MTQTSDTIPETIRGERRHDRRYALDLQLRYKVTRGKQVLRTGTGRTTDISSRGVAFVTDQPLPLRNTAELWVDWPRTLNGCPLRLIVRGRVVRSDQRGAAVRILRHEFRLAGAGRPAGFEQGSATGRPTSPERGPMRGLDQRGMISRLPM